MVCIQYLSFYEYSLAAKIAQEVGHAKSFSIALDDLDKPIPAEILEDILENALYYKGQEFKGSPTMKIEKQLNLKLKDFSAEGIGKENFSAIYEGLLIPAEDSLYQFQMINDDGVHFFLNEQTIMFRKQDSPFPEIVNVDLKKNKTYYIRVHLNQGRGDAFILLKELSSNISV